MMRVSTIVGSHHQHLNHQGKEYMGEDRLEELKKQIDTLEEENCKMRDTLILYNIDEEIWSIKLVDKEQD